MEAVYAKAEAHHPANDHPKWSESYYFNFYDPQSAVGGYLRIGLMENLKQSNVWVILFKDGKPAYNRICAASPYTPDRMDRGVKVAGLSFTSLEPLQKALVEFADDDCSLSLTFEALQPMADSIAMTQNQASAMAKDIAAAHLEGPTRVTGSLLLRGANINVNCTGFRDISWGVRSWDSLHYYRLAWPVFANGLTVALVRAVTVGGQSGYMKMFHDGKEWLPVQEIEDSNEYAEDGMTINSLNWRFRDSLNRQWEFSAKPVFSVLIPIDGFVVSENMMEYRLSDGTVGYGLAECGFRLPWD